MQIQVESGLDVKCGSYCLIQEISTLTSVLNSFQKEMNCLITGRVQLYLVCAERIYESKGEPGRLV